MDRVIDLAEGTIIRGKWYGKEFLVEGLLGTGGTSNIFLVRDTSTGEHHAMKISKDMVSIDTEYSILSELRGVKYIPEVYYRDDCSVEGVPFFFFVMPYYRGENLKEFCKGKRPGVRLILQTVIILASLCHQLNSRNIYYCDLKPENIVFDYGTGRLYLIDFGGVAKKGESVYHFTPRFDRASWGRGERIADDRYQIFALSMMLVDLLIGVPYRHNKDFLKLLHFINNSGLCKNLKRVIIKGLEQEYDNLPGFQKELVLLVKEMEISGSYTEKRAEAAVNLLLMLSLVVFSIVLICANY